MISDCINIFKPRLIAVFSHSHCQPIFNCLSRLSFCIRFYIKDIKKKLIFHFVSDTDSNSDEMGIFYRETKSKGPQLLPLFYLYASKSKRKRKMATKTMQNAAINYKSCQEKAVAGVGEGSGLRGVQQTVGNNKNCLKIQHNLE